MRPTTKPIVLEILSKFNGGKKVMNNANNNQISASGATERGQGTDDLAFF